MLIELGFTLRSKGSGPGEGLGWEDINPERAKKRRDSGQTRRQQWLRLTRGANDTSVSLNGPPDLLVD